MLDANDLRQLNRPFNLVDHAFRKIRNEDLAYLEEDAVSARLDEVDPAWTFELVNVSRGSDKQVIVQARLTVKEVSRDGVGMQKVDDEFGEAEKGAATDALKRCARLFGIGRYLLSAPKVRREFDGWLASQQREWKNGEVQEVIAERQSQPQPQLQTQRRMPIDDDLTDRSIAQAFIEHWRAQSLADSEVLEALGVAKLSLWTKGRKAADAAVDAYIAAKLARTGAGSTALDEGKKAFDDAIYKATQVHFNDQTHFKHFMDKYRKSGEITDAMSSQHIIEFINWNREQEGKSFVSWWQDAIEMKALKSDLSNRFGVKSVEAALELLGLELKDFRSRMDLLNAVKQYMVEQGIEAREALAT